MREIEPTEIGKHADIIKSALKEMAETDVLVCGKCYSVFHFVELFKDHKAEGCDGESELKETKDTKPKVWAFLLWKAAQLRSGVSSNVSAWKLYTAWSNLDESLKDTWVIAGKTILSFQRVGQGTLREMPVKITKTVVENLRTPQSATTRYANRATEVKSVKKDEDDEKTIDSERLIKKTIITTSPKKEVASTPIIINKGVSRRALRTKPKIGFQEYEEETVEKIIAKRFNPRRKFHEYLVKWEGLPHDQNTWEPKKHLESCAVILETFEKQLARQKEQRAAQAAKQAAAVAADQLQQQQRQQQENATSVSTPLSSPGNRPSRNSKVKAVNQVKQWCNEEQESGGGFKRKHDDSDIDEPMATMDDDDDEDDPYQKHAVKRLKNGNYNAFQGKPEPTIDSKVHSPKLIKAINGPVRPQSNEPTAEIILTSDSQQSNIIRKSTTTLQKSEAQVRLLPKGENTTSGVVRSLPNTPSPKITQANRINQVIQRSSPGNSPGNTQGTGVHQAKFNVISKDNIQNKSPNSNVSKVMTTVISSTPPGTRVIQTQSRMTNAKQQTTAAMRSSLSPNVSGQTKGTSPMNKQVVTRVVKSSPTLSKPVTPEQKIIQLSKSGDLKVTRKVVNQTVSQAQASNSSAKHVDEGHDDNSQSGATLQEAFNQPPSPPRQMTLCPVTGKVFADGEAAPSPTTSPDPQEKKENQQQMQAQRMEIKANNSDATSDQKVQHVQRSPQTTTQPQRAQVQQIQIQQPQEITQQQDHQQTATVLDHETNSIAITDGDHTQIISSEDGPLLVTGDDGTIYQVAGKNAEGQTILIAQGADGEQLAYVAADDGDEGVLALGNNMAEVVANMSPEEQQALAALGATDPTQALTLQTSDSGDSQDGNIPAEVVQADLPSPGGTRRVVLLLQDGTFMMTEMHDDEYQALNIAS